MKFSDIEQEKWPALKPFLDTVLLPLTGLEGTESPDKATTELEALRDWLDPIEQQFNGRVITYPAFHYTGPQMSITILEDVVANLKRQGFIYVVAVSAKHHLNELNTLFDAVFAPEEENELPIHEKASLTIKSMWSK